jgi:hypothetical protein
LASQSAPDNFQPERDWQLRHHNNEKAWMLSSEFSSWVKDWSRKLAGRASLAVICCASQVLQITGCLQLSAHPQAHAGSLLGGCWMRA